MKILTRANPFFVNLHKLTDPTFSATNVYVYNPHPAIPGGVVWECGQLWEENICMGAPHQLWEEREWMVGRREGGMEGRGEGMGGDGSGRIGGTRDRTMNVLVIGE